MPSRLLSRLALAVALLAQAPVHAALPTVQGERALMAKAEPIAQLRLAPSAGKAARVRLVDAADEALARVRAANARTPQSGVRAQYQRLVIGAVRAIDGEQGSVPARALAWTAVAGGQAAQVALTSPRAEALRLAIDLAGTPPGVELTFFGSADAARLEGPVNAAGAAALPQPWWSPVTEGETQTLEIFVPAGIDPRALSLRIVRASHLLTTPSSGFTKRSQDIGRSGSCNVDLPCSPRYAEAAFQDAADSVAQMVFNDGPYTALCTGTLLNDAIASTQVPYFYSANHCFENESPPYKTAAQMQVVASTLATLWGFEANACPNGLGSGQATGWTQRSGGAVLLYNNAPADVLLLRLADAPPPGAYFSGWDPNPLAAGTPVVTIHHPQGDLKKVSEGRLQGLSAPGIGGGTQSFLEVLWSSGTTEAGSSGSGLWSASGGQYLLRGGLWGGSALCSNNNGSDFYSRFDQAYPAISKYLAPAAASEVDYTDLWWNPDESGWGLNLVQHPSRIIFGVWYTYGDDGKRTWLVLPSGTWTSSNVYTGALYATSGPNPTQSFDASKVRATAVGTATLTFNDASSGTFAYTVRGVPGSKQIRRQPF